MNMLYACLKINIFKRFIAFTLFSLVSLLCHGETIIPWKVGATIANTTYKTKGETYRIKIEGDVTMNGYIQVGDGSNSVTVIVEIADGVGEVKLTNASADSFFRVYPGSKLIIRGKSDKQRIILDGGSTDSTAKGTKTEMIGTSGTLEMQFVTVQNNKIQDLTKNLSAIKVNRNWLSTDELL